MDRDIVSALGEELKNWGKWGPDDEVGTLNYITPEKILEACRLPQRGKVFSLSIPLNRFGPQEPNARRFNPIHTMLIDGSDASLNPEGQEYGFAFADDIITMPLQCATQWDALSEIFHRGVMYGGRPASLVTSQGAQKNSIDKVADRIITRGVLIDVARYKSIPELEAGYGITNGDLEEALKAQGGPSVSRGDIVLVRTGQLAGARSRGWQGYASQKLPRPGMALETIRWLHQREVAGIATDTYGVEVRPFEPGTRSPFHLVGIVYMGLLLGEIFDLEALAADCAADGVYEFLFVAPPLPVTGAVGSPVNPLAIK